MLHIWVITSAKTQLLIIVTIYFFFVCVGSSSMASVCAGSLALMDAGLYPTLLPHIY